MSALTPHQERRRENLDDLRRLHKGDYVETMDGRLGRVAVGRIKRIKGSETIVVQFVRIKPANSTYLKEPERIDIERLEKFLIPHEFEAHLAAEEELLRDPSAFGSRGIVRIAPPERP